ncbi:HNH endonuclease [Roseomonas sp. BN140053]|uniref:HNH endonuclease n=1 Tax=Roseomonas sp. BN140053 TaxID=3391898 RepID=UPI0039EB68E7
MKGVFDTRAGTVYDDDITSRYHFPNRYLEIARQSVGDWIIYREPRRGGGREGYVAVARVEDLVVDTAKSGFTYAIITDYLPFDAVVPLRRPGGFYEGFLAQVENPSRIGAAMQGRSLRTVTDAEFGAIVRAGLRETLAPANAIRLELDPAHLDAEARALVEAPPEEQERRIEQVLVNRKIRDAAFRKSVVDAYDGRCAVTGLRLINGGGKAEAQAAHILPVAAGGPDVVQNGIALSATVHWLFDRHLISLTDELGLLVSHNRVPSELRSLFQQQMERVHLPKDRNLWPHPQYIQRHREQFAPG